MFLNGLKDFKVKKISNGGAAAQTALPSSTFALDGFDSVLIIADLGTVTDGCVLSLVGQDGAAANGSDAANITGATTGTLTAATSSNSLVVLDLQRPQKEYVTAVLNRTTQNAVVNTMVAILYNAHGPKPVALDASVILSAEIECAG